MGERTPWKRCVVVVALGVMTNFAVSVYCSFRGRMWMSYAGSVDRRATWWFTADEAGGAWSGSGVDDVAVTRNAITGMVTVSTAYARAYTAGPVRWGMRSPGAAVGDVSRDRIAYVCEPWAVDLIAPEHAERGPVSEVRPAPGAALIVRHRMAAGWPMLAFELESEAKNGPISPNGLPSVQFVRRGGVLISAGQVPFWNARPWEYWEIPLRPRWGGLVVNSSLAGAGWWAVLLVPGVVRRWRRQRAGRCVACGYSLAGLGAGGGGDGGVVCPECGGGSASG